MATAAFPAAHAGEIKFTYGKPETFALKFAEPKVFENQWGPRALFTAADEGFGERKIWMDYEDGANLVIEMRRLNIGVGEPMRVTKVKHARGGGHGYLVERATPAPAAVPADAPAWVTQNPPEAPAPSRIEAQLAQSVQMVREHGPQVFQRPAAAPVAAPADSVLMAALKTAIDAAIEATAYAARQGLTLAFGAEDIRSLASTVYINAARGGR